MFDVLTPAENRELFNAIVSAHQEFYALTSYMLDSGASGSPVQRSLNAQVEMTDLQVDLNVARGIR